MADAFWPATLELSGPLQNMFAKPCSTSLNLALPWEVRHISDLPLSLTLPGTTSLLQNKQKRPIICFLMLTASQTHLRRGFHPSEGQVKRLSPWKGHPWRAEVQKLILSCLPRAPRPPFWCKAARHALHSGSRKLSLSLPPKQRLIPYQWVWHNLGSSWTRNVL